MCGWPGCNRTCKSRWILHDKTTGKGYTYIRPIYVEVLARSPVSQHGIKDYLLGPNWFRSTNKVLYIATSCSDYGIGRLSKNTFPPLMTSLLHMNSLKLKTELLTHCNTRTNNTFFFHFQAINGWKKTI